MDLVCESMFKINFMVSARFIAYGIAGMILFSAPDRYGRKWTLAISSAVIILA